MSFEHLILLIGTNPLPNYVVAEYFLKNNPDLKKVWLVYSEANRYQEGTHTYAENLETVLKNRHSSKPIFPLKKIAISDVSNSKQILNDIKNKIIDSLPLNNSVHLNYTGGTKVMGNHVYRAIEQENSKNLLKSFSYLDGRNYRIIDDKKGVITNNDLRNEVSISFEDIIKLHGFKRINNDSDKDFSEAVKVFKKLINENQIDEYFKKNGGYNRSLFENKNKPGKLAEKVSELKDEIKNYKPDETLLLVARAMPEGYQLFDASGNFINPASNSQCEDAIKFLDGDWLEHYVRTILVDGLKNQNIKVDKDWRIKKEGWTTDFQLDVILMKGYQLIGISCTISEKKDLCKSKGFEIIHRIRQIGGDEAKAVLVTRVNDETKRDLQEELEIDTGGTTANILVLGSTDLKEDRLKAKISDFVQED